MMSDNNQTRYFRMRDIVFFKKDKGGNLHIRGKNGIRGSNAATLN